MPKIHIDCSSFVERIQALEATEVSSESLKGFIQQWDDLDKEIDDLRAELYFNLSIDSKNTEIQEQYNDFQDRVLSQMNKSGLSLFKKIEHLLLQGDTELHLLHRRLNELYSAEDTGENIPRINDIINEFNASQDLSKKISEKYGPDFKFSALFNSPERSKRREGFLLRNEIEATGSEAVTELFIEAVHLRNAFAVSKGYDNYCSLKRTSRLDYIPKEQISILRNSVETKFAPLLSGLRQRKAATLNLSTIAPWDFIGNNSANNSQGMDIDAVKSKILKVIGGIDQDFKDMIQNIYDESLIDLEMRKGKITQPFTDFMPHCHKTVICTSYSNTAYGYFSVVHELGHAIHHHHIPRGFYGWYRLAPMSFAEFVAQSFEILSLEASSNDLALAYGSDSIAEFFEKILYSIVNHVVFDEFQEWAYSQTKNELTVKGVNDKFVELYKKYANGIDWEGAEQFLHLQWQQYRVFAWPFYNLEYVIGWLAVLDFWTQYTVDPQESMQRLRHAMELGYSQPAEHLFSQVGVPLDTLINRADTLSGFTSKNIAGKL